MNNRLSDQFSSKSHDDFDDESQNDRFVLDANKNFSKILAVLRSLFVLQCRLIEDVRQTRNQYEIFEIRKRCEHFDLRQKHE